VCSLIHEVHGAAPETKISSRSEDQLPSLSPSCFSRNSRRALRTKFFILTTRRLRFRFGPSKVHSVPATCIVRQTLAVPRCQSMSDRFNARYSLGLIPVVSAKPTRGYHSDFSATQETCGTPRRSELPSHSALREEGPLLCMDPRPASSSGLLGEKPIGGQHCVLDRVGG
jgi:hypothetical protein